MPFGIGKKQAPIVRPIYANLPGPLAYIDILQQLRADEHKYRNLPAIAYPILVVVIWRTIRRELDERRQVILDAEREAIRKSQAIYIAKPRRKRFGIF